MKQQIEIKGMSCGGCVQNVEKALRQIDGVNTVNVDYKEPDPFFNINTKEDLKKAIEIMKND